MIEELTGDQKEIFEALNVIVPKTMGIRIFFQRSFAGNRVTVLFGFLKWGFRQLPKE
jgi:hypothetical protein